MHKLISNLQLARNRSFGLFWLGIKFWTN